MSKILTNKDLLRKIEAYAVPAIVVFVGLAAFGLGRLSAAGEERPPVAEAQAAGYTAAANRPGL